MIYNAHFVRPPLNLRIPMSIMNFKVLKAWLISLERIDKDNPLLVTPFFFIM